LLCRLQEGWEGKGKATNPSLSPFFPKKGGKRGGEGSPGGGEGRKGEGGYFPLRSIMERERFFIEGADAGKGKGAEAGEARQKKKKRESSIRKKKKRRGGKKPCLAGRGGGGGGPGGKRARGWGEKEVGAASSSTENKKSTLSRHLRVGRKKGEEERGTHIPLREEKVKKGESRSSLVGKKRKENLRTVLRGKKGRKKRRASFPAG